MLTMVCLRRDERMQVLSPSSPSQLELCLKAPYATASVLYPRTVPDIPKSATPFIYEPLHKVKPATMGFTHDERICGSNCIHIFLLYRWSTLMS